LISRKVEFSEIPKTSYVPDFRRNGTTVSWILNSNIAEGFLEFGKSMKGYLTNEAILHAQNQEPLRLFVFPRDSVTYE
jgi:hypothetical protein